MDELAHILSDVPEPLQACICTNSAMSAMWLRRRLHEAGISREIRICSIKQLVNDILRAPCASAQIPRGARVALPFEIQVLSHDLAQQGFGAKDIRAALCGHLSNGADSGAVQDALDALLETYQLCLPQEAAQLAKEHLVQHSGCEAMPSGLLYVHNFDAFTAAERSLCEQLGAQEVLPTGASALRNADKGEEALFEVVKWPTPADELGHIGQVVQQLLAANVHMNPADIAVVVPNVTWAQAARKDLAKHSLETAGDTAPHPLLQNPSNNAAYVRAFILLMLAANPGDALAQRLKDEYLPQEDVRDISPLRGTSLLTAAAGAHTAEFAEVLGPLEETEDAAAFCELLRDQAHDRWFEGANGQVTLATYAGIVSAAPKVVLVLGCVDGLVPRGKSGLPTQGEFEAAVDCAQDRAIVSYFQKCPVADSDALQLSVARTKLENGEKMAMTRVSPYILRINKDFPGAISGSELLSQ